MSIVEDYNNQVVDYLTATILDTETESNIVDVGSIIIGQIYIPNTFIGKEITYKVSYDGTNFFDAKNIDDEKLSIQNAITPTTILEGIYCIASNDLNGIKKIKLISDTAQTSDCNIIILPRLK